MSAICGIVWRVLGEVWRWLRVLWVCRVPAFSAIGAGLLMIKAPQARDLFADTGLSWLNWVVFFFFVFGWAWLVHAMARRALQFDEWVPEARGPTGLSKSDRERLQNEFWYSAVLIPRLLGLAIFAFIAKGLCDTRANLAPATGLAQAEFASSRIGGLLIATAVTASIYLLFVVFRRAAPEKMIKRMNGGKELEGPLLIKAHSMLLLIGQLITDRKTTWPILREIFSTGLNFILLVIAVLISVSFVLSLTMPAFLSDQLPRAIFVPVLFGSGLLLFGEIASLSHRFSTPLLLVFFVIGALLGKWLNHYNDVHWFELPATSVVAKNPQQMSMSDAITRWKADNGCLQGKCDVRPIVIAGAGGASRAGFYTASVVGALMDAGPSPGSVRNRIFALSTVSGSSVGAVMMRAAWMDAIDGNTADRPPCSLKDDQSDKPVPAWFRDSVEKEGKLVVSWRDCFQKLMVGDFLSPVFVGLVYRDHFPLGGDDRSGLLEQAFER